MENVKLRERIRAFLSIDYGYGSGDGYGHGSGHGYGSGSGSGSGDGSGSGYGSGSVYGDGSGYGSGSGIKAFAGAPVNIIDGVQTIIDKVKGNVAKGRVLMRDLTTRACYIVKQNGLFAHGGTLREARAALVEKLFDGMDEDERIEAFMEEHKLGIPYPNEDLYNWHHRLTGSCDMGRKAFVADHGLSLDGETTVEGFVELTKNAYGGSTIRKMAERYGLSYDLP